MVHHHAHFLQTVNKLSLPLLLTVSMWNVFVELGQAFCCKSALLGTSPQPSVLVDILYSIHVLVASFTNFLHKKEFWGHSFSHFHIASFVQSTTLPEPPKPRVFAFFLYSYDLFSLFAERLSFLPARNLNLTALRIPNSFTSRCRSAAAPSRPVRLPSIDARSRWKTRSCDGRRWIASGVLGGGRVGPTLLHWWLLGSLEGDGVLGDGRG